MDKLKIEAKADHKKWFDLSEHCAEMSDSDSRSVRSFDELVHGEHWMHINELLRIDDDRDSQKEINELEFEEIPDED